MKRKIKFLYLAFLNLFVLTQTAFAGITPDASDMLFTLWERVQGHATGVFVLIIVLIMIGIAVGHLIKSAPVMEIVKVGLAVIVVGNITFFATTATALI